MTRHAILALSLAFICALAVQVYLSRKRRIHMTRLWICIPATCIVIGNFLWGTMESAFTDNTSITIEQQQAQL